MPMISYSLFCQTVETTGLSAPSAAIPPCRRFRREYMRRGGPTAHLLKVGGIPIDSSEGAERIMRRAVAVDLLILDFAFRKLDQREAEMLYVLAEERLGRASTVLTSNRPPEDRYAIFPDTVVGGAILDRLVSSAIKIITTQGKSYRREVMGAENRSLGDTTR